MHRMFCLILFLSFSVHSQTINKMINHKSISVGEHSLHFMYISGTKPAIVFESGSGFVEASHWENIMKSLSSKVDNAIISYDRAGYGKSELPLTKYNIEDDVEWLRKGLDFLGHKDSIIYVGWSYGHYLMQTFGYKYPKSINSMLYIDPVTIEFIELTGGIDEYMDNMDLSTLPNTRFGDALRRETMGMPDTLEKVKKFKGKGLVKCSVIVAEKPFDDSEKVINAWKAGQVKLAEECSTNIIIAKGSNHDVPTHSPEIIVDKLVSILRGQ